ncbi:MAG: MarR family EPS-associated transcriptional regulator [Nevskiaceae bacterium]|nr:MAG: MarR family EPS-associated transcriptional regulator [Nevskiaceae bacterium]
MTPEQEAHFRLLKVLEQYPEYSQREIAEAIGLSLGRTNYVIHALMGKGFLKIVRFLQSDNKLTKTAYILTAAGIRHRVGLTQGYIERKNAEYEALRSELESLRQEVPEAFEEPDRVASEKRA